MEAELILASESLFGTADYESALSVLPAYDGAVREFRRLEKQIREKQNEERVSLENGRTKFKEPPRPCDVSCKPSRRERLWFGKTVYEHDG